MTEYACNYALLRFLPYRDGGEFVNVGVVLACAATSYLDFRIEVQRWARVSHFFPEIDVQLYRAGLHDLGCELERWQKAARQFPSNGQEQREAALKHLFGELTRPKQGIFYFAEARTVLANDPGQMLDKLFQLHVHRKFHSDSMSSQQKLQHQIAESLRSFKLDRYYKSARVGSADYFINLPFVASPESNQTMGALDAEIKTEHVYKTALRAITPLDLDREEPSEITQRGDEWRARIHRLGVTGHKPKEWLFVIREPKESPRAQKAGTDIRQELERMNVETISGDDTDSLIEFARLANNSN